MNCGPEAGLLAVMSQRAQLHSDEVQCGHPMSHNLMRPEKLLPPPGSELVPASLLELMAHLYSQGCAVSRRDSAFLAPGLFQVDLRSRWGIGFLNLS